MFVLDKERIVKWPVVIDVPVDGGELKPHQIEMSFRLIDGAELPKDSRVTDFIVGWDGVFNPGFDGAAPEPLPFSAEALARLMRRPYAARAVVLAYQECFLGARRKNSATPLAIGPAATTQQPATT